MWETYFGKRLKSFKYAIKGAFLLVRYEASIQVQSVIAIIMTVAGFYFEISNVEWMLQVLAIGLVISIEGANTAVEKIADFIHPEFNSKIGFIKDIAAGAVFFAAVSAVITGCIIYIPKL